MNADLAEWQQILKRMFQKYGLDQEWDLVAVDDSSCSFDVYDSRSGSVLRMHLECQITVVSSGE